MNKENILQSAINVYGEQPQMIVAMEEMAELIKELSKYIRGENNLEHIAEEIADVEIMIEQLKLIFNCFDEVEKWEEKKLKRLEKRLEGKNDL